MSSQRYTVRLVPSTCQTSSTALTIENATNMYNNVDNTSYATVSHDVKTTSSYRLYLYGFNFNSIPSDATIESFTFKLKMAEANANTNTSYRPQLAAYASGTTWYARTNAYASSAINQDLTNPQTVTFTCNDSWDDIVALDSGGNWYGIYLTLRRLSSGTKAYWYIFGAEIEVTYTVEIPKNIISTNLVGDYMLTRPSYAYDSGLILNVTNMELSDVDRVGFMTATCIEPIIVNAYAGVEGINAIIPDILFEDNRDIYAYLMNDTTDINDAIGVIRIPIIPRRKATESMTESQAHDGIRPSV